MPSSLGDHDAVFLDVDPHVVPHTSLVHLSSLSSQSLEPLATAAASELTAATPSVPVKAQATASSYEVYAAMCTIVATCARDGDVQTLAEQR